MSLTSVPVRPLVLRTCNDVIILMKIFFAQLKTQSIHLKHTPYFLINRQTDFDGSFLNHNFLSTVMFVTLKKKKEKVSAPKIQQTSLKEVQIQI